MAIAPIGSSLANPVPVQPPRGTGPTAAPEDKKAAACARAGAASTALSPLARAAAEAAETPTVTAQEALRGDLQAIHKEAKLEAAHKEAQPPPKPGKLSVLA
jgi:hypothetical protein